MAFINHQQSVIRQVVEQRWWCLSERGPTDSGSNFQYQNSIPAPGSSPHQNESAAPAAVLPPAYRLRAAVAAFRQAPI